MDASSTAENGFLIIENAFIIVLLCNIIRKT